MNADPKLKNSLSISIIILVMMAFQSILGMLFPNLYRDNAFVTTTWKGNDMITLFLVIPVFITALIFTVRGSIRAKLVLIGVLDYALYNYGFYLFGTSFNVFFLLYVTLFGLSIFALILNVTSIDLDQIKQYTHPDMPVKFIAGYMLFVAFGLSLAYMLQSIGFIFTGELPDIITRSGNPTSIVFALDLTLLIPFFILGACWLLKRNPWGLVITSAILVKGPLYTIILALNTLLVSRLEGQTDFGQLSLWIGLTIFGLIAVFLTYRNIRQA